MSLKSWAVNRLKKMDAEDSDVRHKLLRRSAFHDYFDGYTEIMEPAATKRGFKVRRVYTAHYYRASLTDRQWLLRKVLYCTLYLLSAAALGLAAWQDTPCNYVWYCTMPQAMTLGLLALLLVSLINYAAAPRDLKLRDFKQGVRRVQLYSLLTAAGAALTALGAAAAILRYRAVTQPLGAALVLSGCLICAAACFCVNRLEGKVEYAVVSNPAAQSNGQPGFQVNEL